MGNLTTRLLFHKHETILFELPKSATATLQKPTTREHDTILFQLLESAATTLENSITTYELPELPESCISAILSFTTPRDICRLSTVSKVFRSAAYNDSLWNKFIPHICYQILSTAVTPVGFSSKRELYFSLCDSILIDGGTKRFWVEASTGKIGYMLSARQLYIVYGEDQRFWHWLPRNDSRFKEVAELLTICWLEVRGGIDCRLLSANTWYRVVFLLKFGESSHGWSEVPITFKITTPEGDEVELEQLLMEGEGERRRINGGGWMEVVAGEFTVRGGEYMYDEYSSLVKIAMNDEKMNWSKGGLLIDGVRIEPKLI